MKILVFDNDNGNLKQAAQQLQGHQVTLVSTYDEAQAALTSKDDEEAIETGLVAAGFPNKTNPWGDKRLSEEMNKEFRRLRERLRQETKIHPDYDVVLTDLLVLPSKQCLADKIKHYGQLPLGAMIVLLALQAGIKKIGLLTDVNHHQHPASAAIDAFQTTFTIAGEVKISTSNNCNGKNWQNLLESLSE